MPASKGSQKCQTGHSLKFWEWKGRWASNGLPMGMHTTGLGNPLANSLRLEGTEKVSEMVCLWNWTKQGQKHSLSTGTENVFFAGKNS